MLNELFIKYFEQRILTTTLSGNIFQQAVALLENFLINNQMFEIAGVDLA